MLDAQAQLSGALEEELGGLQVAKHSRERYQWNLILSPIKHLKFALDNYMQKTVAHLENKEKKEVKNIFLPSKQKPQLTQRLTGIHMLFMLQFGNKWQPAPKSSMITCSATLS